MAGEKHEATIMGEAGELARLLYRGRKRLFDERVLTGREGRHAEPMVRGDRRRDDDRIDRRIIQDLPEIYCRANAGIAAAHAFGELRARVAHERYLGVLRLDEIADEVRAPIAETDHRDLYGLHAAPRWRKTWIGVLARIQRSSFSDQPRA